ncbi:MAG: Fe(3+) ABC transporter substrate-binding protein [Rhodospirillales bacterium]|nr:Fe(3+) ABC transporter substrate-binding protein [Rhodospirillales bacterium]
MGFLKSILAAGISLAALASAAQAAELNIYSAREEALIRPQLDAFTAATGIKVNLVTGKAEQLAERLKAEGANSPADLFFTVDAGNLSAAKAQGLFQPMNSAAVEAAVPAQYRDPEGYWTGLGMRARPIFLVEGKVDPKDLKSYEDLADPKWRGRILVRSSGHVYNQSLLASLIHHDGAGKAESWAKAVVDNLARKPQGGDRDQIKAAAAGEGDVVLANTYYFAQMLASDKPEEREAASRLKVLWPNQDGRGAHVNVSGAGLTAAARNKAEAVKLLEYLTTDEAQKIYAQVGQEYPVKPGVALSPQLESLGSFKADTMNLAILGKNNAEAVKMFDRVGWR